MNKRTRFGSLKVALFLYVVIVLINLGFALFPLGRSWGVNVWAYYPTWIPFVAAGVAIAAALVIRRWPRRAQAGNDTVTGEACSSRKWVLGSAIAASASAAVFYLFRLDYFFLGDGYTLLSQLTTGGAIFFKSRNYGESVIHEWFFALLAGDPAGAALTAYRIISIAAGALLVLLSLLLIGRLFERLTDRLILSGGLLTGGYVLLYFGYVENYSIFVFAVGLYCLIGLVTIKRLMPRWAILPAQSLVLFLHVFGTLLLPPTVYLLLRGTRVHRRFRSLTLRVRLLILLIALGGAGLLFAYYYQQSYFFRFALVPVLESRFTISGYTLVSLPHLLDMVNLLLLLVPGSLLLLAAVVPAGRSVWRSSASVRWLVAVVACCWLGAFLFDPKLGMPRDWDLFSFSGVPLGLLLYYAVVTQSQRHPVAGRIALLAIVLGVYVLTPRVITWNRAEIAVPRYRAYLALDEVKARTGWVSLINHYEQAGDTVTAEQIRSEWLMEYPVKGLMADANRLYYEEHRVAQTMSLLYQILRSNPVHSDAYGFLGYCYLNLGQYDSALTLLRIADGLNPNRINNLINLGETYRSLGEFGRAEEYFLRAINLDSSSFVAYYNLSSVYRTTGRLDRYLYYLEQAAARPGALPRIRKELVAYYARLGRYDDARRALQRHPTLLEDSVFMEKLQSLYPALGAG